MLFIEMLGIIKCGERKLEKIFFFFESYLYIYFILKENFKFFCKSYFFCSCCRVMIG